MKFCKSHWNQLRTAIDEQGLGHLVGKNSESAVTRIKDEFYGIATDDTFDPLLAANFEIIRRFMEPLRGKALYMLTGDYCPLCELERLNPGRNLPINWINGVAQDLRKMCEEKGLAGDVFGTLDLLERRRT